MLTVRGEILQGVVSGPGSPATMDGMSLLCPRCRVDLEERAAHELQLHGCTRCGGVWLQREGVARLGEALSHKTLAAVDSVSGAASRVADEARPIDCPQCAEILLRTPIPAAGVSIDRCPDHGAWYDRDELQKVARALGKTPPPLPSAPPKSGPPKSAPPKEPATNQPAKKAPPPKAAAAPPTKAAAVPPTKAAKAPPPSEAPPPRTGTQLTGSTLLGIAEVVIEVALSFL